MLNSGGLATLTLGKLPVGSNSIKASYAGDGNYKAAASAAITVTMFKASQNFAFMAPANDTASPAPPGQGDFHERRLHHSDQPSASMIQVSPTP